MRVAGRPLFGEALCAVRGRFRISQARWNARAAFTALSLPISIHFWNVRQHLHFLLLQGDWQPVPGRRVGEHGGCATPAPSQDTPWAGGPQEESVRVGFVMGRDVHLSIRGAPSHLSPNPG